MTYHILIAEDDQDIVELLRLYLENNHFHVLTAANGKEALELLKQEKVDLLIVDIMMPKMNGYETIKAIRQTSHLPILVLSAKSLDHDKIIGLDLGADMYMVKPFNPLEVIANIKALLRRSYQFQDTTVSGTQLFKYGDLEYDPERMVVLKNGKTVPLTACELKILVKLMSSPGRVFTKSQLYEATGQEGYYGGDDDTMMVHISRIRAKIEDQPSKPRYIQTIRGLGYKFEG